MSTIHQRRRLIGSLAAATAAGAVLCLSQTGPASAATDDIRYADAPNAIEGSYIVVYKQEKVGKVKQKQLTDELATRHKAKVKHRFEKVLNGFSGEMTEQEAKRLAADPNVEFVEQNRTVTVQTTQTSTPSWGLDRIDQRDLPLDKSYSYDKSGTDVRAYIIDTGIRTTHADFGGRASWGTNTTGDGNNTDCNGHGTHVAGTVGGTAYGVAKDVRLVAVKVLTCSGSGSTAGVVAGIDWVTNDHQPGQPAVANMSLGATGTDIAMENAVRNSIADGVVYSIASGNSNADACNFTPARVSQAITVNASTNTDARASFSNFGTCTDIFAPGQGITSDWITNDTATNTISGTSMATPHVTGAAALVLAADPTATPATVATKLVGDSTSNKVTSAGTGSPNRLLYTGLATQTPAPPRCNPVTNGTDVAIHDLTTVSSTVSVAGCSGNASAATTVSVNIVHSWRGDLVVDLIAPNGTVRNLLNRSGGSADNVNQTFTVDMSSAPASGTWTLRVQDTARADTGYIDSWTVSP